MTKTMQKMRRLRKGRCTALLVLAILVVMFLCGGFSEKANAEQAQALQSVIVAQGDTLWGLVSEHCNYKGDIREGIYEVRQLNGLADAKIVPGQLLLLPPDYM